MNIQGNPYVGPRTFLKEEGHLFFGRDREARDLSAIVAYDKLVLFYAQSGAGKSSLINTRLIPELENKLYEVLPVARVSGNWPEGSETRNIYIYNLIRSLIKREIESNSLVNLSLSQFLARLNEDEGGYFYDSSLTTDIRSSGDIVPWPRALIIDQFEELFSTHPEAWQKREDFFNQLAQAMQDDAYLWVVLVMREDYIAALDPYAHLLPGRLRTRYYMQRLSLEAAIKAVKKPVENLRPYDGGVAEKLVEDLSSIKVQKPNGKLDFQPGQYVEPVQLQVVCYGLWQNLPTEGAHITEKDLEAVGDVDEALGKYYAGRVAEVATRKGVKERLIRDWIERKLIAPGGIRSMVLQETNKKSSEISDDVIQALQSDLVRSENRGGAIWYELTHDRLVSPILNNNKKWFDENLSPLQRQATLWNDQQRNESWLLRDQALIEVEDWANKNPDELTDLEKEFLKVCRDQQNEMELKQQAESAQRLRRFVAVVGILAIIAVFAALSAFRYGAEASSQRNGAQQANTQSAYSLSTAQVANTKAVAQQILADKANAEAQAASTLAVDQAKKALSGNLAAQADSQKNIDYPLALLLGVEAYNREPNLLTQTTLFQLLQFTPYERKYGFDGPVSSVAVSPDGKLIASASCTRDTDGQCKLGEISLFDADLNPKGKLEGKYGVVYSLAFNANGNMLAAGGCVPVDQLNKGCADSKGQITVWDVTKPEYPLLADIRGHTNLVKTIAFSHDGRLLASGSYDTTIILWDIKDLSKPAQIGKPLKGHSSFVNGIAFSFDDKVLISASDDQTLRLWNVSAPENMGPIGGAKKQTAPMSSIAFTQDGKKIAAGSDNATILLWDWDAGSRSLQNLQQLEGHTGFVKSIAFSADGAMLASAGFDNRIILWDTGTGRQLGPSLSVHSGAINTISFGIRPSKGQELPYLISGSNDRTMIRWDVSFRRPLSYTLKSQDINLPEGSTAAGGELTATANGQQIDVKRADTQFLTLAGFSSPIQRIKFDGQYLLTMDQNQVSKSLITYWSIDPSDWVKLACDAVGRNLTDSEWKQYLPNEEPRPTCESNS